MASLVTDNETSTTPSTTSSSNNNGKKELMSQRFKNIWKNGLNIPPEDVTEKEKPYIPKLRDELIKARGECPDNWRAYFYKDHTLLRFLRARDLNLKKATFMITEAIKWFEADKIEGRIGGSFWEILDAAEQEDSEEDKALWKQHRPHGIYGIDRRGNPVQYFRYGGFDDEGLGKNLKGLKSDKDFSNEGIFANPGACTWVRQFMFNGMSNAVDMFEAAEKKGEMFMGTIQVWDLKGTSFGRSKSNWPYMAYILGTFKILDNFPEATKTIYFTNAPWFMKFGLALLKPLLPAATRKKLSVHRTEKSWLKAMQKQIDLDQIPEFLGGTNKTPWPHGEGGVVHSSISDGENEGAMQIHVSVQERTSVKVQEGQTVIFEFKCLGKKASIDYAVFADETEIVEKTKLKSTDGWSTGKFEAYDETTISATFTGKEKDVLYRFTFERTEDLKKAKGDDSEDDSDDDEDDDSDED